MKRLVKILLILLIACSTVGCGSKQEETVEPEVVIEPVGYSEKFLLLSPKLTTIEELSGKRLAYSTVLDADVMQYVIDEISSVVPLEEITLVDFADDYVSIDDMLRNNSIDAFIILEDVHESIIPDYRFHWVDYKFNKLGEYQMPYYEEKTIDNVIANNKLYTEPFAVMIDGIDGAADPDANAYLRNDVNHLMVVDPVRNHITMISFPRDSYVLNNKTGYRDKLTHHGLNGVENIKRSIEGLLEIEIPYYMQVSFSSFVQMINVFGGVWIDVPLDTYMDMDSNRDCAIKIEVPKGRGLLYGEEALALSRNRKYANIYGSDEGRLRNQALIMTSMMEKITRHPKILEVAHVDWWFKYLTCNNFEDSDLKVLVALANKFAEEGYTVDNYFVTGYDDYAGDMYVLRLYDSSVEIAKGKFELAMTGMIDENNPHYDEIMTGWINRGTGTYEVGFIGEDYDLHEIFGLSNPNEVSETATSTTVTE